ncbi:hypothetical protein EUGRSUZ_I02325 [Eucalyptus grandis]|uniref:Uncharacterized protein n=2 Tax=Eucalyptus grandis TaxID=71139 RepID=A0ACC3JHQ3_EUCGR|nr:hypothetical protein EUGRSUZ_I02325 [Eucalyptus grandis]
MLEPKQISGAAASVVWPRNVTVPAAFAIGDSVMDPGNNNGLVTVAKCNFPPYGRDLDPSVPLGRCSNGRVPSDMLAETLGVKKFLPAYLDPNLELQDLLTGVSFASGANGYDPLSAKLALVLSLSDQLDLYSEYLETIRLEVGAERASAIASESVYILCTGTNDITNTYFATLLRRSKYDVSSYTDLLVSWASSFLRPPAPWYPAQWGQYPYGTDPTGESGQTNAGHRLGFIPSQGMEPYPVSHGPPYLFPFNRGRPELRDPLYTSPADGPELRLIT